MPRRRQLPDDTGSRTSEPVLAVRLTPELYARAERLVPVLRRLPEAQILGHVSITAAVRVALARGLTALEQELLTPEQREQPLYLGGTSAQSPPRR